MGGMIRIINFMHVGCKVAQNEQPIRESHRQAASKRMEHRLGWLISGFAATVHPLPLPILAARTR